MRSEKSLVVDVGDVENAEAVRAHRRVGIFAAQLDVENVSAVAIRGREFALALDVLAEIVGIGHALQIAADDGLGLIVLRGHHGFETLVAGRPRKRSVP